MLDFTEKFCFVHDFCKGFENWWNKRLIAQNKKKRKRKSTLSLSEIITILIMYHESGAKCFKSYYFYLLQHHYREFPGLLSYSRFITLMKRALPATILMFQVLLGEITEILFVDSTPYRVCHYTRRHKHKVFEEIAALSKNSQGWFYGMKLHLVLNAYGEIVRLLITPANVDDRVGLKQMLRGVIAKVFGDKGYLGKDFFRELFEQGVHVVTRIKKNMKNSLMNIWDKLYLKKRSVIETVLSSIKSCKTFEHSRHRNVDNAFCHIITALIAYQLRPVKSAFIKKMAALA